MHTCPDCGQACYCRGDIEDHDTGEDDQCEHYQECNDGEDFAGDEDDGFGCCYPGECCMPGLHMRSECHTPEDVEAQCADHVTDAWKMVTPNVKVSGLAPRKDDK